MSGACYRPSDNYLPASFKGVPFEADSADSEHGRRGAEGEFPFGEKPAYADLGRRIRTYSLRAKFQSNNHRAESEALIAVCESRGAGLLVHPTRGPVMAACRSARVTDSPTESAGVTYIELDFVEANEAASGLGLTGSLTTLAISGFITAVSASFRRNYSPSTARTYNVPAIISTMNQAIGQLQEGYLIVSANDDSKKRWDTVRDFNAVQLDEFVFYDVENAVNVVKNAFAQIDAAATGSTKFEVLRKLINWSSKSSSLAGESADSQNAIFTIVRLLASAYLSKSFTEEPASTIDEALIEYDQIMTVLEQEAELANEDCGDNELFLSIRNFTTSAARVLLERAYNSPTLVIYAFPGNVHMLVAAWEIFGDAKRASDMESRNKGPSWAVGPKIVAERVNL